MNFFRSRGCSFFDTCSADTVVPRITKMSTPHGEDGLVELLRALRREGARDGHAYSRISARRLVMSSARMGALYSSCIRRVAAGLKASVLRPAISSRTGCGSS